MTVIACEYLDDYDRRRPPRGIPPELAQLIARKAEALAAEFKGRALDELNRAARSHLRTGETPEQIARLLGL
ncbi:hypothetical protein D3C84_928990 [compost metagenome]